MGSISCALVIDKCTPTKNQTTEKCTFIASAHVHYCDSMEWLVPVILTGENADSSKCQIALLNSQAFRMHSNWLNATEIRYLTDIF